MASTGKPGTAVPAVQQSGQPLSGALVGQPHRKLRVCVLHSSLEGSSSAFKDVDPDCKPDAYDTAGKYEWSSAHIRKATAASQLVSLVQGGQVDVFLNLCDGGWDEDRAGKEVVEALERLNVPYTGANAAFYEPSKVEMKMAAMYYGVQVPAWTVVEAGPGRQEEGLQAILAPPPERGGTGLRSPLIVKHPSGYGSVGMTKRSKVTNEQELREQVALFVGSFGGALVEEFVTGREFTVLVVEEPRQDQPQGPHAADPDLSTFEPVAYQPIECAFGPGEDFKHFDLKWTDYESLSWRPCEDAELNEKLKEAARNTFVATRGVSYGRCDFRVDERGEVYLLEINPNCGVLYPPGLHGSADYILSLDPTGKRDHMHFIDTILASAVKRHQLKQKKAIPKYFRAVPRQPTATAAPAAGDSNGTRVDGESVAPANGSSSSGGGWGLVAIGPIRAGEVVQRNEQRPHVLASRGFVQRCWPEGSRQRSWFGAYAYPISDEVWVTWSDDPAAWAPLNHSCDPNTWLMGLDAVARRDIAPGEQITMDYATFCANDMEPFDCSCGAVNCRGRITGQDYLLPFVREVYGSHVSPYVAEARRRRGLDG